MRVRFVKPFDYTPSLERRVTIAYPAGRTLTVKRECGDAAIAAGAAVEELEPARNGNDGERAVAPEAPAAADPAIDQGADPQSAG